MASKDLISSLPNELLGKILSSLCTKEASSTSVLSKRWRNLLAFVDNLDLRDASGNHPYFCDSVDNTLALLRNYFRHDESRIDSWIRTVLERGFLELSLKTEDMHCIDMNKLFTRNTLVKLTTFDGVFPDGRGRLPRGPGSVLFIPNHRVGEDSHHGRWFETPSLVYLDYTSYVSQQYHVDFDALEEARLVRSWGPLRNEYDGSEIEGLFGDVTYLVHGIRTVTTLHLSSHSLEGLEHEVTDMCGDFCVCIPERKAKKKKTEEGVCCLSTCQVKVLNILGYTRTCAELKQMKHLLGNLKFLQTVNVVGVKSLGEACCDLMSLPRVSSNSHIRFF